MKLVGEKELPLINISKEEQSLEGIFSGTDKREMIFSEKYNTPQAPLKGGVSGDIQPILNQSNCPLEGTAGVL